MDNKTKSEIDWKPYFDGSKLYGDDFSIEQIEQWYEDEKEAYADLGSGNKSNYDYQYHYLNIMHGFDQLPKMDFDVVLGYGAAYGYEFIPIQNRIKKLIIVDTSEQLTAHDILKIPVEYKRPPISGKIDMEDCSVDLVTSFGTLHHIPNVSYIMGEIYRILKPGGFFLYREPVVSMGDWRQQRIGLTKHERGIPYPIFLETVGKLGYKIRYSSFCFSFLDVQIKKRFNYPIMKNEIYCHFDKIISNLVSSNLRYHAVSKLQRIRPTNLFCVLEK